MQKKFGIKAAALVLCLVMAAVFVLAGCSHTLPDQTVMQLHDGDSLGEGAVSFQLRVVDQEGKAITATIHTDEKMLGKALQDLQLVAGEMGDFGLYIKTVNGLTLDYDRDGWYWSFYVGDAYATASADQTEFVQDAVYTLKAEKAS